MNQQWLTTLMSNVKARLESQLESRGIRLNSADIAAVLEDISPKASHAALGYAIALLRPFSAGMGMRISRLTDTQVELILPMKNRNLGRHREIHEGALLASATEAAQLLWDRHAPIGEFKVFTRKAHLDIFKHLTDEIRIRLELPEPLRESVLAQVRKGRKSQTEMLVHIYDAKDLAVAEVRLNLEFLHTPVLGSQG